MDISTSTNLVAVLLITLSALASRLFYVGFERRSVRWLRVGVNGFFIKTLNVKTPSNA
jgi:hypothetical protein